MEQEQRLPLEKQHSEEYPVQAQQEAAARQIFRCANCDIEFFWSPTVVQDKVYCCTGCAAGGPCNCDYSLYRTVIILGAIHYDEP